MELYNSKTMPFSRDGRLKNVQEKIINGDILTMSDKIIAGRDHPVKEIYGYKLKPDHAYRAVNEKVFEIYREKGVILGNGDDDEYVEYEIDGKIYNNNKGVDWYLGGAELKYGDIILECPANKEYFTPAYDNGNGMSFDPTIKFLKSSGSKNTIPVSMITRVFNLKKIKEQQELNGQKIAQLYHDELVSSETELEQEELISKGMSR